MTSDNRSQGSTPGQSHEQGKKAPSANQAGSGSGQSAQQPNRGGNPNQPHGQKMQDSPKKR